MNATIPTTNNEPEKKAPEGENVNWLVEQIGWPLPTWIEQELYNGEFKKAAIEPTANSLIEMFNDLGDKIGKALATDAANLRCIKFKYYRKISEQARKTKATTLKATLYKHPDYDKVWMLVEAA